MGNQWRQGTVQVWKTMFQNVSYLGFDPPHQNLQWVQYARGFMGLGGEAAWQGTPPGSPFGSPPAYLIRVHASSAIPAQPLSSRVLLTVQSGKVILPTWHHFDHLLKETKKNRQQKWMLTAFFWRVPLKLSALDAQCTLPLRAREGGRSPLPIKQNLPLKADS